jgi:hypothetical protein
MFSTWKTSRAGGGGYLILSGMFRFAVSLAPAVAGVLSAAQAQAEAEAEAQAHAQAQAEAQAQALALPGGKRG